MRPHDPDDDLRGAFKNLRAEQERSTPPFKGLWRRAQSRARPRFSVRPSWFAAASLLLAVGLAMFTVICKTPSARVATAPAFLRLPSPDGTNLIQWRSPTDSLLNTPGANWLTTTFHPESHALPAPHSKGV